ncbi:MAG: PaaI family thioesterase, partial [Burkholderiaceae bacterium]
TSGGIVHGGALMSLADCVGALGAFLNLPEGAKGTTTIESKTNFLAGAVDGSVLIAEALPVRIGRRLSVWQTRIAIDGAQDVALVTQTQLVL